MPDSCAREMQLLLACSRTTVDAARALRVRELVQQGVNWDDVLASAEAHDTRPLLARALASTVPDDIPAHVTASLRRWVQANRLRSMRLTAELARLSRALQQAGVVALPLKGPLLAEMAYGDITLRYSIDLDLLVRRQNLERALAVLADSGYQLSEECRQHEQAYRHVHNHLTLVNGKHRMVEVHWRLAPRHFAMHLGFDDLWRRRSPLSLGGASLDAPSPTDMLLIVCVHGALHGWRQLKNVCDVAELIQRQPMDWPAVWRAAGEAGVLRMVVLGLALSSELLQAPLPAAVRERITNDPALPALYREILPALLSLRPPHGESSWRSFTAYYAQLRERQRDRAEETLRRLFIPTMPEWESYRLPASLSPLAYAIRPVTLLRRSVRARLRRAPSLPPAR